MRTDHINGRLREGRVCTPPVHIPLSTHTTAQCMLGYTPMNRMTDTSKNITFASRSVVKVLDPGIR